MKKFQEFMLECYDMFSENRVVNQTEKNVKKWIKSNGFFEVRSKGKHPILQHNKTGRRVPGYNTHGKNVSPQTLRNMANSFAAHHKEYGIQYTELK